MRRSGLIVSIALLLAGCGNTGVMTSPHAAARVVQTSANAPRFANRVVVKYRSNASESAIRSFQQRFALSTVRDVSSLGMGVLALPAGLTADSALTKLASNAAVEYVEPDYVFTLPKGVAARKAASTRTLKALEPDRVNEQWGMLKIGMPEVWKTNGGSPGVVVAVVDTGVDLMHPDLRAALIPGKSVLSGAASPDDDHGHGTHVAGVIAASLGDRSGIAGVAPNCKIMPVKVLNAKGQGDTGDIVAGLLWAVNNGAKVVNMSLGGTGGSKALMAAVKYAQSKDVVVVAAMGNATSNSQEYPAGYPGVIAVGAIDDADQKSSYSNWGSWISVAAPGDDILSTLPTHAFHLQEEESKLNAYDTLSGTSMASPFVAGLAALIRSAEPTLTAAQVKTRLERSAVDIGKPGFDEETGWGRIDARRALSGR